MNELFVRKLAAGTIVFKEGAKDPCMYHVRKGKVGIYSRYGKKNEKCLTVISAEDHNPYFGEMALVDHLPRSATAVALEDCELGEVTENSLRFYFQRHPELTLDMLHRMSGRLRALTDQYMDACHVIAEQQAARIAERENDPEWLKTLKKYTAIFDDPPTDAELAALTTPPRYTPMDKSVLTNDKGAAVMEAKLIPANTVIFKQGDVELCMYDLIQGSVGIYADYGLPTQKKLTTLSPEKNRFLGEMGLIDAAPRSATAVAETDCKVLTVDAANMNTYFLDDPDTLLAVMRQMSDRIREMTGDYMEAVKTISENERYEQKGGKKPDWLVKNLKFFADVWKGMSSSSGPKL